MAISSISEYYDALSTLATSMQNGTAAAAEDTDKSNSSKERDSYVSTITDSDAAIPCENYNDILTVSAKSNASEVSSEGSSENTESGGVAATGGGSGGSGSDEEETTTETVTINGVTYLETTTTVDGVTTTTRTVLSGGEEQEVSSSAEGIVSQTEE